MAVIKPFLASLHFMSVFFIVNISYLAAQRPTLGHYKEAASLARCQSLRFVINLTRKPLVALQWVRISGYTSIYVETSIHRVENNLKYIFRSR